MKVNILFVVLLMSFQTSSYKIAVLKYQGGGDWYANPTSLPNLVDFCNNNINTNIDKKVDFVDVGSPEIFNYPFIHMTGHGNVVFSQEEAEIRCKLLREVDPYHNIGICPVGPIPRTRSGGININNLILFNSIFFNKFVYRIDTKLNSIFNIFTYNYK